MIKPGDKSPNIVLQLIDGSTVDLSAPGEKLVIYFFPKAFSPVCTKEACSFRDAAPRFEGVKVLGISRDSKQELLRFQATNKLDHQLVSDEDGTIHQAFGALLFGKLPRRATISIGEDRTVISVYANDLSASGHAAIKL